MISLEFPSLSIFTLGLGAEDRVNDRRNGAKIRGITRVTKDYLRAKLEASVGDLGMNKMLYCIQQLVAGMDVHHTGSINYEKRKPCETASTITQSHAHSESLS